MQDSAVWPVPPVTVRFPRRRGGPDVVPVDLTGFTVTPSPAGYVVVDRAGREHRVTPQLICGCVRDAKLEGCEHAHAAKLYQRE